MRVRDAIEGAMQLFVDDDQAFWADAGPAVLRLRFLEIKAFLDRSDIDDDMRARASSTACELRRLIAERPSISACDRAAKLQVFDDDARKIFAPDSGAVASDRRKAIC